MKHIESSERISTGAVKFGEDWPGVFISGDEALSFANVLEMLCNSYDFSPEDSVIGTKIKLLRSCAVKNH